LTSPADPEALRPFDAWNERLPSVGELAFAAFWIATGSGALLAIPFDVAAPADSIQILLLTNPAGAFLRGLHYWSAQLFLVLTALHLVEHVARRSEARVRLGVWLRLVASTAVVVYLMVSGYVLKGDAEGELARQVLAGLLERLPAAGESLRGLLVGSSESLQLLYVQHAATATLLTLAFIVEHFRRTWPGAAAWLVALAACGIAALALPPALQDPGSAVVKGPWYMLGLQEVLHWLGSPGLAWLPLLGGLAVLGSLPRLPPPWSARARSWMAAALGGYLVLVGVGAFLRGADWEWRPEEPRNAAAFADPRLYWPDPRVARGEIPVVLGRREGCLPCHSEVHGLTASHSPEAVGCAACHLGRPWTGNADLAHSGLVRVPGNLSLARETCGSPACHPAIVDRVDRSLMASGAGLVGVNRFVFGEAATPDGGGSLRALGASPADRHLDDLCASCHLGVEKEAPARIDELSRGGGCTACHLNHHEDPEAHPALSVRVGDEHCFGCHSRSGRISLSYAGWHEADGASSSGAPRGATRRLLDGRVVVRRTEDVHHAAGLACVDCHTAREVMGDGRAHRHEEEALEVACRDCHLEEPPRTLSWDELDEESRTLVRLRAGQEHPERRFLVARRSGLGLVNAFLDEAGEPVLEGKLDGRRHPLRHPSPACSGMGHDRVSCRACHAAWAPRCVRCHTQLGSDGQWHEAGGDFRADPPSLGVRGDAPGRIVPFAPGMILTLGTEPADMSRAYAPALALRGRFERLFAPVEPHTTSREGRSCQSCHADPVALGLGAGELRLDRDRAPAGWIFEPTAEPARDGLPQDAWTGFLAAPSARSSTRSDARPFDADEQRRILRVGACLTCHEASARERERIYGDFARALARATPRCVVPAGPPALPGNARGLH